jgi:hypothetical protein
MNSLYSVVVAVLLVTLAASANANKAEAKKWVVTEFTSSTLHKRTRNGRRLGGKSSGESTSSGKKSGKKSGESTSSGKKSGKKYSGARTLPPSDGEENPPGDGDDTTPPTDGGGDETTPPDDGDDNVTNPNVCANPQDEFVFNVDDPCYDEAWGYTLANTLQTCLTDASLWLGDECRFFKAAIAEDEAICNDNIPSRACTENYCDTALPASNGGGRYGTDYNLICKFTIYNCCTPMEDLPPQDIPVEDTSGR